MFELVCFIHYFGKSMSATVSAAAVRAVLQPSSVGYGHPDFPESSQMCPSCTRPGSLPYTVMLLHHGEIRCLPSMAISCTKYKASVRKLLK